MPVADLWSDILDRLFAEARMKYEKTADYACRLKREKDIDMELTFNLLDDQKEMVDAALLELGEAANREARYLYRQGLGEGFRLAVRLGNPAE